MLDVEHDLLLVPIVPDEGMDSVTVRDPTNESRVWGERNHRVALDAKVAPEGLRIISK